MARNGGIRDDHVHHPRTKPEHDQFLLTWPARRMSTLNIVQQRTLRALTFLQA
jgi:hypothetical protein